MTIDWQKYTTADSILQKSIEILSKSFDAREARNISIALLQDLFSISQTDVLSKKQLSWQDEQYQKLHSALQRLIKNEPLQHITEKAYFMGLAFHVNASVLIPRPETEELVQWILSDNQKEGLNVLDIGTGSGCIAISLALKMKHANVDAWEVNDDALQIARQNAQSLNANVVMAGKDILQTQYIESAYDIIVSNPPYIPQSEKSLMHQNVLDHEPDQALFVKDNEALLFYEKITDLAKSGLKEGGKLYFEINEHKGAEVKKLLEDKGFTHIEIGNDMQGKDRMVRGVIKHFC